MIVDYKKFSDGRVNANTLVVGEQLPGYYVWTDLSATLSKETYWASYVTSAFVLVFI